MTMDMISYLLYMYKQLYIVLNQFHNKREGNYNGNAAVYLYTFLVDPRILLIHQSNHRTLCLFYMKRVSVAARGAANRLKETMNEVAKPVKCEYHDFSDVEYVVMDRHMGPDFC